MKLHLYLATPALKYRTRKRELHRVGTLDFHRKCCSQRVEGTEELFLFETARAMHPVPHLVAATQHQDDPCTPPCTCTTPLRKECHRRAVRCSVCKQILLDNVFSCGTRTSSAGTATVPGPIYHTSQGCHIISEHLKATDQRPCTIGGIEHIAAEQPFGVNHTMRSPQ